MHQLRYTAPSGRSYDFYDLDSPVGIPSGGFNLKGQITRTTQQALGRAGSHGVSRDYGEMIGSLRVVIWEMGMPLKQRYEQWLEDWSLDHNGLFLLKRDADDPGREASVKLREPLPGPEIVPENSTSMDLTMPLVAEEGAWWGDLQSQAGNVSVTNPGNVMIWPAIRWRGDGGRVVLPSGAVFTLPPATYDRILLLDDEESCVVLDTYDNVDEALWDALDGTVMAEGIPAGSSAAYLLPEGASLEWRAGYMNPWS